LEQSGSQTCALRDRIRHQSKPQILNDKRYGTHNFYNLSQVTLHAVELGDKRKPLILYLHGFPGYWLTWEKQLPEFKKDYYNVAIDMRGYGLSSKPEGVDNYNVDLLVNDVKEIIAKLGKTKAILVTHDWGVVLGFILAGRNPELVDKLIAINGPHPGAYGKSNTPEQYAKAWYVQNFLSNPYPVSEIIFSGCDFKLLESWYSKANGKPILSVKSMDALKYTYSMPSGKNGQKNLNYPIDWYRANAANIIAGAVTVPQITVPTLILWGDDDILLESHIAEYNAEFCTNAKVVHIPTGTHFANYDEYRVVNKHIRKFLQ